MSEFTNNNSEIVATTVSDQEKFENNPTITINEYTFDLVPTEDPYGLHFVYHGRFVINPNIPLLIMYKNTDILVHQYFLHLQPSPVGDQCIYIQLADDLVVSMRGIHKITKQFLNMLPNEFKKDILNKEGWFACSMCEVIEGKSLGEFKRKSLGEFKLHVENCKKKHKKN